MGNFSDKLNHIRGVFYLEAYDPRERLLWSFNDNNLVVTSGRSAMAGLLAEALSVNQVTSIGFADEYDVEDKTINDLSGAYIKTIDSFNYPDSTSVKFNWSLGFDEHNGYNITNYGLYTTEGSLFAMKVRPQITKDQYISLNGSWTILL